MQTASMILLRRRMGSISEAEQVHILCDMGGQTVVRYSGEKQVAIEAVTRAARLCEMVRLEMVIDSVEKPDRSPVTIADFGSQALVCQQIRAAFPRDPIVGEEDSAELLLPEHRFQLSQVAQYVQRFKPKATPEMVCRWIDAGGDTPACRFWTVDPIDGTKGFLRNDQYAVALALLETGVVRVAALACPAFPLDQAKPDADRGVLFIAVHGQGASVAPLGSTAFAPIRVTRESDVTQLRMVESAESEHGDWALQQAVAKAVGVDRASLRMDSQVKYGAVARGDAALYLRLPSHLNSTYRERIWDHAAGALIVEEAGGCVTDMLGRRLDLASDRRMHRNRGVVTSNGLLHTAVLDALAGLI
jgi:3'(2'), 5'-bisphosphate nucleotidase